MCLYNLGLARSLVGVFSQNGKTGNVSWIPGVSMPRMERVLDVTLS